MKKLLFLLPLVVLMVLVGCPSSAPVADDETEVMGSNPPKILDHKNSSFGGTVPFWLTMPIGELEDDERFEDQYVFKIERSGEDLQAVQRLAAKINADTEVAALVQTRVQDKFVAAIAGDDDASETYAEEVIQSVAQANISGLRKYDEYWVLREFYTPEGEVDRQEYTVFQLYTIEQKYLDELIEDAIDGVEPETEEEERTKSLVEDAMNSGL